VRKRETESGNTQKTLRSGRKIGNRKAKIEKDGQKVESCDGLKFISARTPKSAGETPTLPER
jgi:hypothetical protein